MGRPAVTRAAQLLDRLSVLLSRDFDIEVRDGASGPAYKLATVEAFLGQEDHSRHEAFLKQRARIS